MGNPAAGSIPAKPFANSYWVKPGKLLAGEYPAVRTSADTKARLQKLLQLGIDTFIDLTQPGEVAEYAKFLPKQFDDQPVRHLRFSIPDHDVPSPELVRAALDEIDAALAAGSQVYVHCRAGIGRTGTLIGCHLTREGYSGEAALEKLNELWHHCGRARTWPTIPETTAQIDYVRGWREVATRRFAAADAEGALLDRYEGTMFGLAVGDAFGNGPSHTWSSDTAMTCCLAASLLKAGGVDAEDQMQHYLRWQRGEFLGDGQPPAVPSEVRKAIGAWLWSRKPVAGSHDPANLDAHPLARTAAIALRYANEPQAAITGAVEAARTTLQSPVTLDACRAFAALLVSALAGATKAQLAAADGTTAFAALRQHALKPPITALLNGGWRNAPPGADIVGVLANAWRHLANTSSFDGGMLAAIKDAPTPATTGAVYGALAGAHYGGSSIRIDWRSGVVRQEKLSELVVGLFAAAKKK